MKIHKCAVSIFLVSILVPIAQGRTDEDPKCKPLDIREFGLVSDGEISGSWSEVELIEKYGPPCMVIDLGEVYIERVRERIVEIVSKIEEKEKMKSVTTAHKKQYIYSGGSSEKTSVFTILAGVVVKKERLD